MKVLFRASILCFGIAAALNASLARAGWFWQNPLPQGNTLLAAAALGSSTVVAVGDFGTVMKTTDGGGAWTSQSSGTTNFLFGVSFLDANTGIVVGAGGTVLRTADGGDSWTRSSSPEPLPCNILLGVSFRDAALATAVGHCFVRAGADFATIFNTADGGATWFGGPSGGPPGTFSSHNAVSFVDASRGFAVGGGNFGPIPPIGRRGTITLFSDGTPVLLLVGTNFLYGVSHVDAKTATAVGEFGTILRTTDGGGTWTSQSSGTTFLLRGVSFVDANTGTAVGALGTILRTTDGGETWTLQPSGTTTFLSGVFFVDANTGWAVGGEGTILHTTDGGDTWALQPSGTTNFLSGVFFVDAKTGTVVGQFGTILRTTTGGE